MAENIKIKDLEWIASKSHSSQGGMCGDIDPYISFYRDPKTNEIYFCDNLGFENYSFLCKYQGNLKPEEIKELAVKLDYTQFRGLKE